jgi:hypothetical protein
MYPHVIVSLEPGDAVVFWKDVVYSGVACKEDCNYKCFISVRPKCGESFENAIFPVFVTGRQACRLDSPGSRAMAPFKDASPMRCVGTCAQESSNLKLKWLFRSNCILNQEVYERHNLCIL